MNRVTQKVNAYIAILLITIVGAGASLIILRTAERAEEFMAGAYFFSAR